jgi:RNA polymerase sigma factor (sigma-70 family)
MLKDELLKIQFICGSRRALQNIYEQYHRYLLTLAIALLHDVHTAEDVLQDVFVRFAQSRHTFKSHGSLKSFLATCVINRARDALRQQY